MTSPTFTIDGEMSPRTADRPMAFTRGEFLHGLIGAWGTFMLELLATVLVAGIFAAISQGPGSIGLTLQLGVYAGMFGGFGSLFVTLIVAPIAWCIGLLLQHERRRAPHLLVYTTLGIATGVAVGGVFAVIASAPPLGPMLVGAAYCVIPIPLGWWFAARRALHARPPTPHVGAGRGTG